MTQERPPDELAEREATRRVRLEEGLLPDGREPIYVEDYLVEVWRLQAAGREREAHSLLTRIWSWAMDATSSHAARTALRLLGRFSFITDYERAWLALPEDLFVYRAETNAADPSYGVCWTLNREIAQDFAERHDLPVTATTVAKRDVLAYITDAGEEEIVVRRENVRDARTTPPSAPGRRPS